MNEVGYMTCYTKDQLAILCAKYDQLIDKLGAENKSLKAENEKLKAENDKLRKWFEGAMRGSELGVHDG